MKLVKNLVFAGLLVSAISLNTLGGETQMPAATATPTPTPNHVLVYEDSTSPLSDPYTGEITAETTDYLFFEALAALLSVY